MAKGWLNDTFDVPGDLTAGGLENTPIGDTTPSTGDFTQVTNTEMRLVPGYIENLSLVTSGGTTLTIASGDGSALSSSNPGYVAMPSGATPGEVVLHTFTANVAMTNTEMNGNLLGTTSATAWGNSKPLYLYVIQDDSDANPEFALAPIPNIEFAPASTEIGDPSSAVADEQISMYSLDDITETSYDGNPVQLIGCVTATKSSGDVWTFDSVIEGVTGMGRFAEQKIYTFPTAQFGAGASSYCIANGGTAPAFSTNQVQYSMKKNGNITIWYNLQDDGGTDGSGAVDAQITTPFYAQGTVTGYESNEWGSFQDIQYRCVGGTVTVYNRTTIRIVNDNTYLWEAWDDGANALLDWGDFTNGSRNFRGEIRYTVNNV